MSKMKALATALIDYDVELANDLYFALDEEFVKKRDNHQELTDIVNGWVRSSLEEQKTP